MSRNRSAAIAGGLAFLLVGVTACSPPEQGTTPVQLEEGPAEAAPEGTATEAATPSIGDAVATLVTPSELPSLPSITTDTFTLRAKSAESIGLFTTTIGRVHVTPVKTQAPARVKVRDDVLSQDLVETERRSRAKILFIDGSILSIGEQSRLEITEHVFDSKRARPPSMILKLLDGTVKAVVGKVYGQEGARFEIHTPTAVAAARGTNFIVSIARDLPGQPTTILVIAGTVQVQDVKAVGVVTVNPGQFTLVQPGAQPTPSAPAPEEMVARLTTETRIEQTPESAKQEAKEPAAGMK